MPRCLKCRATVPNTSFKQVVKVGRRDVEGFYCVRCSRSQPGFRSLYDFGS